METLIEEALNNNCVNFFVIFVNHEANCIFWPTYVEIWVIRPILVRPNMGCVCARFGCPQDFIALNRIPHDGLIGRVYHQNILSDPFPITGGLKQRRVMAPTCFH